MNPGKALSFRLAASPLRSFGIRAALLAWAGLLAGAAAAGAAEWHVKNAAVRFSLRLASGPTHPSAGYFVQIPDGGILPRQYAVMAVSAAITQLSRDLMARCIVVETRTGRTASIISSDRPSSPIIALTPSEQVLRRLQLLWGVVPLLIGGRRFAVEKTMAYAEKFMKGLRLAKPGDHLLLVRGIGYKKSSGRLTMSTTEGTTPKKRRMPSRACPVWATLGT